MRKQTETEVHLFKDLVENSSDAIGMSTPEGRHYYQNAAFERLFGDIGEYPPETVYVDKTLGKLVFATIMAGGNWQGEVQMFGHDRTILDIFQRAYAIKDTDGQIVALVGLHTDITASKRAEEALRENEQRFRWILENSVEALYRRNYATGHFDYISNAITSVVGQTPDEFMALTFQDLIPYCHPDDVGSTMALLDYQLSNRLGPYSVEYRFRHKDGTFRLLRETGKLLYDACGQPQYAVGSLQDITENKRAEKERVRLEEQLQQAQKMESVGRLAGGVAHDFNNMLGVIIGYADLALECVGAQKPLQDHLMEIRKAAERSADLTRQLLAFARKQTVSPKVININETIAAMFKMLKHLIGEDIELIWQPGGDIWPVIIDPSQIDQILANLCVNARDAISDIGRISIKTDMCTLDEDYCAGHAGFTPGDFVRIMVSDNGSGMDKSTLDHIFEPFFTTKGVGVGTGLGLATVYGTVMQNKGFINVSSEPAQGTTFTIYLPRYAGKIEEIHNYNLATPALLGKETILLVEDEPPMREMAAMLLERQGYTVVNAGTPGEAMRLARKHAGKIHLLITDVVMPEMNGRELAENLLSLYPHLKRLFMSGYTANIIAHHGVLEQDVFFIQKPFTIKELAVKVREALESE